MLIRKWTSFMFLFLNHNQSPKFKVFVYHCVSFDWFEFWLIIYLDSNQNMFKHALLDKFRECQTNKMNFVWETWVCEKLYVLLCKCALFVFHIFVLKDLIFLLTWFYKLGPGIKNKQHIQMKILKSPINVFNNSIFIFIQHSSTFFVWKTCTVCIFEFFIK